MNESDAHNTLNTISYHLIPVEDRQYNRNTSTIPRIPPESSQNTSNRPIPPTYHFNTGGMPPVTVHGNTSKIPRIPLEYQSNTFNTNI